jgi:hypothetical protein
LKVKMWAEWALDIINAVAVENGLVAFSILFSFVGIQSPSKPTQEANKNIVCRVESKPHCNHRLSLALGKAALL